MGIRFRTTLDWSWSSVNDDVSAYIAQLDDLEQSLFRAGASATAALSRWKTHGSRMTVTPKVDRRRAVTPDASEVEENHKRQKVH